MNVLRYKQSVWLTRSSVGVHPNLSERMVLIRPQSRVGIPTNSSTMYCFIRIIISHNIFRFCIGEGNFIRFENYLNQFILVMLTILTQWKRDVNPFYNFFYKIGIPSFLLSSKFSETISFRYLI